MATLQKIRSKGVLLLVVIGLALLAFILGDAWKIMRPNQGVVTVGEVNGKTVNAQDYQNEVEKYSDVLKFTSNISNLSEEEYANVKDEVWSTIVRKNILGKETSALGLQVTDAEIQAIIEDGTNSLLRQTPFSNPETGAFDVDYLRKFLSEYNEMKDDGTIPAEYLSYYDNMYNYWCFVEDNLRETRLYTKYLSLVEASILSNPVADKDSYETRVRRNDVLLASVPYTSIADSLVSVTSADLKNLYDERKELYYQDAESRDINYIDVEILPSEQDRAALMEEIREYAGQLAGEDAECASIVRASESAVPYSDVPRTAAGLPDDVVARLDSVGIGRVAEAYYNEDDDTYNTFKIVSVVNAFDSIQFCQIQVVAETPEAVDALADSIFNAVNAGADMAELAAKYSQSGEPQWLVSSDYQLASYSGDNAVYLNKLNSMKKGEVANLKLGQATLILKVTDTRNLVKKYNAAIVKKEAVFSSETGNEAYNALNAFVASNNTAELLAANAEENGYRLLSNPDFQSYSYNIGGLVKSHDALRWAFDAKPGEVSRVYEVGENSDHLLVVALNAVHKKGYRTVEDVAQLLQYDATKAKKAEVIVKDFAAAKSFEDLKSVKGVKIDTVKYVNFTTPAYISSSFSSEPLIGAAVFNIAADDMCAPVKGEGSVWAAKKLTADNYATEYDAKAETARLRSTYGRVIASQLLQELYKKADVEDTRYKTF